MSILFYKRPKNVLTGDGTLAVNKGRAGTARGCSTSTIPPELSFENVICNNCLPPCSLQDFLDYLTYVTHDAENLQFYLWMVDYCKRFRNAPKTEKMLAPKWKANDPKCTSRSADGAVKPLDGNRDIDLYSEDISNGSTWEEMSEFTDEYTQTMTSLKFSISPVKHHPAAASVQWQATPQMQPFRAEVNRIIAHYISPGSPRQLNLSHNDRATVLRALEYTTHPSALRLVRRMLDSTLRNQSHPNFIRWTICNSNKAWTMGLRIFALMNLTIGFVIAIVLTLSKASRWWRILAAIEWWIGFMNLMAVSQGLCILLHSLQSRQYHAWETTNYTLEDDEARLKGLEKNFIQYESTRPKWPVRMEVFGPANNYSGELWVRQYSRKPWYRKLFEKRVAVHETGLKNMQNRIIRQAEVWALLITIPLTIGFVAIPSGNLY